MTDQLVMNGQDRARYGFILQAVGPTGARRTWVRRAAGHSDAPDAGIRDLLREVASELDALPGEWRVATISTPATIYRDLQGSRRRLSLVGAGEHARTERGGAHDDFSPERILLGAIGRLDLLA